MEAKNAKCGCKADLKKEVKQMVNEVEGYTKTDREKKAREVKAAFGEKKPAAKAASTGTGAKKTATAAKKSVKK